MVSSDTKPLEEAQHQHREGALGVSGVQALNTDEDSTEELQAVFDTFDENKDGKISSEELRRSMAKLGFKLTQLELMTMMESMDLNGNGYLEFDEFTSLCSTIHGEGKLKFSANKDQDLWEAFCVFDRNEDGFITVHELQYVFCSLGMGKGMKLVDFENMIRGVDEDGDGQVSFPEFKVMMNSKRYGRQNIG